MRFVCSLLVCSLTLVVGVLTASGELSGFEKLTGRIDVIVGGAEVMQFRFRAEKEETGKESGSLDNYMKFLNRLYSGNELILYVPQFSVLTHKNFI